MCYRVKCQKCGKITWGGCGRHIQSALKGVKKSNICRCNTKTGK